MESEIERKHPPDWGAVWDRTVAIGIEDWEEGQAGPSDYARRAWMKGMRGREGMEFGSDRASDDEVEGGVSGLSSDASLRRFGAQSWISGSDGEDEWGADEDVRERVDNHRPSPRTHRKGRNNLIRSLLPLALPLLPTAFAAPPLHTRPSHSHSPSAYPTAKTPPSRPIPHATPLPRNRRNIVQYQTSAAPPAVLPTQLATVDETLLPYIMSRGPDGYWTRVDEGWRLYGRQSGESPVFAPDQPAESTTTWAVEEALPPGWGVQSTRTNFYQVPLIVVASCLIAVGMVVIIIVAALKRKKAHRRAKRRAERQRRKALAAAGLTEEDVNDSRNQANLREKLDDLQRQHRAKRKGETAVVSSSGARARVRSWRAGMLKRRKGRAEGDEVVGVVEEKPEEVVEGERDSQDTDRSTPTVPSDEPSLGSDGIGSRLNTLSSEESSTTNHTSDPDPPAPAATPYFPPAYRPASVRSVRAGGSTPDPSAQAGSSRAPPSPVAPAVEKVHAPGYYPAPATAEGEAALAVASRSEGKGRMAPPEEEEDRETGHAATDDKLVMERMRMAASAPPVQGGEEDGPSAPIVELDQDGFERYLPSASASGPSSSFILSPPVHPSIPAPPASRPHFNRSYSVEREVHEQLDELNLLPSAPPVPRSNSPSAPTVSIDDAAPSAPPLPDVEEDIEDGPSAPPLPEEDEEEVTTEVEAGEEAVEVIPEAAQEEEEVARRPSEAPSEPRVFLPKYEP